MSKTRKNRSTNNKTRKHKGSKQNKNKTERVFKKNDYYSGDGFLTSTWGPPLWHALHTMSFNYPVNPSLEDKHHYRDFILSLKNVLPCGACRKNLKTNFRQLPITMADMKNRDTFSRYMYNLHELVNRMLKKSSGLSYCDIRERYEHFRSRCTEEKPKIFKFVKLNKTRSFKKENEKGCTEPLYGQKSKCILKIVPQGNKEETMQIDEKCIKTRASTFEKVEPNLTK
jgi:hypothetical protein